MGAGKSQVGEELSEKLGYDFIDTDRLIVEKVGKKIPRIFEEEGEEQFRTYESEVIEGLKGSKNLVISVGGGAYVNYANRSILHRLGQVIYLKASANELYARIKNDRSRPLLQSENPRAKLDSILKERETVYEQADIVCDTELLSVPEVVDEIIDRLAERTIETEGDW